MDTSSPFGIMFGGDTGYTQEDVEHSYDQARAMGAQWARTGMDWRGNAGTLEDVATKLRRLKARAFRVLLIVSGWAESAPASLPDLAAGDGAAVKQALRQWGDFVATVVQRLGDLVDAVEVWNEPNAQPFFDPPDARAYARILQVAYARIKRIRPHCPVVGGSMAGCWFNWMRNLLACGAGAWMDVFAFHPYRWDGGSPQCGMSAGGASLAHDIETARELLAAFGSEKPIWITEIGWSTTTAPGKRGVTPAQQANYLHNTFAVALASGGVERVFVYSLKSEKWENLPWDVDWQNHMGLVDHEFRPKPAYEAYRAAVAGYERTGTLSVQPCLCPLCATAVTLPQLAFPFRGEAPADEGAWESVRAVSGFLDIRTGKLVPGVRLHGCWTRGSISVRVVARIAANVKTAEEGFDGVGQTRRAPFAAECSLAPAAARREYFQFSVSQGGPTRGMRCCADGLPLDRLNWKDYLGTKFDTRQPVPCESRLEVSGDRLAASFTVPFAGLGLPETAEGPSLWRFNACVQLRDGAVLSLAPVHRNLHQPRRFCHLQLEATGESAGR